MKPWVKRVQKWVVKDALHQNLCALATIIFIVLLGNIVFVSGYRDPNPSLQFSGIATNLSGQLLKGSNTLDGNIGITTQALGSTAAHELLHGHMPYWNYYEGLGAPLAGEMQSAAFLPTTLLLPLANGVLIEHIFLEIIAGYFTYLFIKRLGLRARVALLGGVMFALNGTFAWLGNAAFNPIAFLPVMLYGVEAFFIKEKKSRTWLWLPIGLALSLYAGFPETAFIDALLVGLWTLARLWQNWPKITKKKILVIASSFLLGILLAAPILVLFTDYLPNANVGDHTNAFAHSSLSIMALPTHVLPYIYGTIGAFTQYSNTKSLSLMWGGIGGYVNITVLFLAVIGLFSRINSKLKGILAFWIFACLLKTFGFGPAEDIWNLIPTIKNAAFFRYCTPSIYFAATILAAYGLQGILTRTISRARLTYAYITFGVILVTLIVIAKLEMWHIADAPYHIFFALASVLWAVGVVVLLASAIIVVKHKYLYPVIFLIVSMDVVLMFLVPTLSTPKATVDRAPVQFLQKNLGTDRFYTLGPIQPNYGSYFNISEVDTNDLPVPTLWTKYFTKKLDTNTDPIVFTGTYLVNSKGPDGADEFLKYEKNYEYIGTKYILTWLNELTNSQVVAAGLSLKYSNSTMDIYQLPYTAPYYQASGSCSVVEGSTLASVKVNCSGTGSVIRKELYMPGWKVSDDGKTTSVNEYHKLFQSIKLGKGTHNLNFTFSPPHILWAWLLFVVSVVVVVYSLLSEKLKRHTQIILKQFYAKIIEARK